MLRRKALRKIFVTTLTIFILMVIYLIPQTEKTYKANLEVENIKTLSTNNIYLLNNKENRLVKTNIFLTSTNKESKIRELLKYLTISKSNNKIPSGLSSVIPKNTKIKELVYDEEYVTINFSKEFNDTKNITQVIEAITYSIMDLEKIKNIIIEVEGECLKDYCIPLDKSIGINKEYNITSRENINKVTIYYLEEINNEKYYVPVTKYINSSKSKIEVIIEELASKYIYESNLMSFLNDKTKLLNYKEEANIMFLNFNNAIFDSKNKILEEVAYSIAYSVFDNYNVSSVFLKVNNDIVREISQDNK